MLLMAHQSCFLSMVVIQLKFPNFPLIQMRIGRYVLFLRIILFRFGKWEKVCTAMIAMKMKIQINAHSKESNSTVLKTMNLNKALRY